MGIPLKKMILMSNNLIQRTLKLSKKRVLSLMEAMMKLLQKIIKMIFYLRKIQ